MPLNIIKKYNQLLDLVSLHEQSRTASLKGIFNRDFVNNSNLNFRCRKINPTPQDGVITMDTLFSHLTTVIVDKKTRSREFDIHRAERLHWVKFHINESLPDKILVFSVDEPEGARTYIYDKAEKYVVVLEPLRKKNEYYLLTAYHVKGKDAQRGKFEKKYKRKLDEIL